MTLPTDAYTAIEASSLSAEAKAKLSLDIQQGKISPADAMSSLKGGSPKKKEASTAPKTKNKKMGIFDTKSSKQGWEASSKDE